VSIDTKDEHPSETHLMALANRLGITINMTLVNAGKMIRNKSVGIEFKNSAI
tara:strand:+ start:393 stop:548 length:156 start_codon:yes stop_codon:yes gene_type:complete